MDFLQEETEITEMDFFRKNSVFSVCSCEEVTSGKDEYRVSGVEGKRTAIIILFS